MCCFTFISAEPHKNHGKRRKKLSKEAKLILLANLTLELDFYNFVRQRLMRQNREIISHDFTEDSEDATTTADDTTTTNTAPSTEVLSSTVR